MDHLDYCSETCLQDQAEIDLRDKWTRLQREKGWHIPRPKLGTILLERAFITPEQLDAAIRMQRQTKQGRLGEWLQRLGFVEERQITMALSRQFGIPMIHLQNAVARTDATSMIPGPVAKFSNLVPVGYDDDRSALRIAVSGPVDFSFQEAIRRMLHIGVITYIGDESAIRNLLGKLYRPEDLDLSSVPTYNSLNDLLEIGRSILTSATDRRAANVQFELVEEYLWARLDYEDAVHHQFFQCEGSRFPCEERVPGRPWTFASATVH